MKKVDVIIVGAGIAGLSAGIYLRRSNIECLVLDKGAPGGRLLNVHEVDNYPSMGPISGPDLAMKAYEHAMEFGVPYEYGEVASIQKSGELFLVMTTTEQYECKAVIIATGTEFKKSGVPGESEFVGRGVSYCASCDGNFFKGKPVAVIGSKEQTVQEAMYLSGLASTLYFVAPEAVDAAEIHFERLKEMDNVVIKQDYQLKAIKGAKLVSSIVIEKDGVEEEIAVNGVFPLFGYRSSSEFLNPLGVATEHGFITVDGNMESNVKGLYAAGDIVNKKLRQVVTAASDGAIAATSAISRVRAFK